MEVYQNHKNDNDKNHIYDIGYYGFLASKANTKKGVFLLASSFKIKKCPYKKKKAKKENKLELIRQKVGWWNKKIILKVLSHY